MQVVVYLRLDILHDLFCLIRLSELLQVLRLLDLHQLDEDLTDLPILRLNLIVLIECCYTAPFLLELDVHLSDSADGVGLLPNKF